MKALAIAVLIVGGFVVAAGLLCVAHFAAAELRRWWRARRYADTPWTHYCHPDTEERVWRIGVERRTPDGRVLDPGRQEMERLPLDAPEYERLVKVADAESRANAFNLARVGM